MSRYRLLSTFLIALAFDVRAFGVGASSSVDPLSTAAEYYFSRQEFRQAYELWTEVYKRKPDSVSALVRLCELRLLFESRAACRDSILQFLKRGQVTAETRRYLREKLTSLQAFFLTDEGQTAFLQAMPRIRRKDCAGALPYLDQALQHEKGNTRILAEKAACEKAQGLYDRYYETLQQRLVQDPFDVVGIEELAEAHLYFSKADEVVSLYSEESFHSLSSKKRTALGVALAWIGKSDQALAILQGVVEEKGAAPQPVVWYQLGKLLAKKPQSHAEATQYLERFLASTRKKEGTPQTFDPYRLDSKTDEVRELLAQLKS